MAFRSRSQRKTKKIPEPVTVQYSPDANAFNLQILEVSYYITDFEYS